MRIFSTIFFLLFTITFQAQNKDVLFTVDDDKVYATEFIRVFNKNLDLVKDESQKDIDAYLKLFVNYKLKLKEAKTLGLDTMPKYLRELKNYKKQLAKNFVVDNKVTDALVEEAYNRISNEVNASHILIRLDENANPKDTLEVYNALLKFREQSQESSFEEVSKTLKTKNISKTKRGLEYNGKELYVEDLGYFTGFKMVYPFESVAYNTPIGEVSLPFKTEFGYHILNVNDKRKSRGKREVAHIMVALSKEDAEGRIKDIYTKLEQGEDFHSLAKQFSEDKSTASKGGKLSPFASGELRSAEFEKQAFDLVEKGDFTLPFKTDFGWHIIKLIDKIGIAPLEDMRGNLEAKVKRDSRSKLISDSRVNKLKERYKISNVEKDLMYFTSILNDAYFKGTWMLPKSFPANKNFVKIENKQYSYQDFANFIGKNQRKTNKRSSFKDLVATSYNAFLETNLLKYQEENLENENEEFANILGEYRDGLLLFDLMENKIWKAAANDTLAVQEFYNKNKDNYFFNERVDAIVASSAKKKVIKQVAKLLKKGKSIEEIKKAVNTDKEVNVIFTSGLMNAEHQALPEGFLFKKGVSKITFHNDAYVVVKVNDVLPKTSKSYEEAKGRIASDFQDNKEKEWLEGLTKKYKVSINQSVLDTVKSRLNN